MRENAILIVGTTPKTRKKIYGIAREYACLRIKNDYLFPISAYEKIVGIFGKKRILKIEADEKLLYDANLRLLAKRTYSIYINGEIFATRLMDEYETLRKWAKAGVKDENEYCIRLSFFEREFADARKKCFNIPSLIEMEKSITALAEYATSEKEFQEKRAKLVRITSPSYSEFRDTALHLLHTGALTLGEICARMKLSKSTCHRHLERMVRGKLLAKMKKHKKIGRPCALYDVKQKQL
ncbi:MAG: helix-turn-helix domain-containing protein [Candidatus Micrarchaeia archaeon]